MQNKLKILLAEVIGIIALITPINSIAQEVSDYDGNSYGIIQIGTQKWIDANLRTTHFSNGDTIPTTSECNTIITDEFEPKYRWAYNCDSSLIPVYGLLYTWYVAGDSRNVCPSGWHIPTRQEFNTLENYLGGSSIAGGKLKETGNAHWLSPNAAATNEYNYNGVPNGNRNLIGTYNGLHTVSDTWTATEGIIGAQDFDLNHDIAATVSYDDNKEFAFALRCINDTIFFDQNFPLNSINLNDILIYPIPAKNSLNLQSPLSSTVNYQIISLSGDLITNGTLEYGANVIPVNMMNAGVYLIQLQDNTNSIVTRIFIE